MERYTTTAKGNFSAVRELTADDLDLVSGGDGVSGATGPISYGTGTRGSFVSWPGAVDGISGTWTMSKGDGLSWQVS